MNTDPMYPIREVAAQTGVNPVTLRAWQRRFGLLSPKRTDKGHRLYSQNDIERIQAILQWLEKGVAISQIKPLLDHRSVGKKAEQWQAHIEKLQDLSTALDSTGLRAYCEQLFSLYPFSMLADKMFGPWFTLWQKTVAERADGEWLDAWLQQQMQKILLTKRSQSEQNSRGQHRLICHLQSEHWWPPLLIDTRWSLAGYKVESLYLNDLSTLPLVTERLQVPRLLINLPAHLSASEITRLQALLHQSLQPVALCGEFAPLYTQLELPVDQPGYHNEPDLVS